MSLVIESFSALFLEGAYFAVLFLGIPTVIILIFLKAECLLWNREEAKNMEMQRSEIHYVMFLYAGIVVNAWNPEGFWLKVGHEHIY